MKLWYKDKLKKLTSKEYFEGVEFLCINKKNFVRKSNKLRSKIEQI